MRRKINGGCDERYCDGRCWQRDDAEGSRDPAETVVGGGRHGGSMNHEDWFAHGETMQVRKRGGFHGELAVASMASMVALE